MNALRLGHVIWSIGLSGAQKPFFPGGGIIPLRCFQNEFLRHTAKIMVAERLIGQYGLRAQVKLGKRLLADVSHIATHLYKNAIHPRFFTEVLHFISSHADEIKPRLIRAQLANLRREIIRQALKDGKVTTQEIGEEFEMFSQKDAAQKIDLLERLGVLELTPPPQPPRRRMPLNDPKLAGLPLFCYPLPDKPEKPRET